jgi:putative flippase GtrA
LKAAGQFLVYGGVGLVNTAVDFAIFLFAIYVFGIAVAHANIISWLGSSASSYLLHSHITFRETVHEVGIGKRIVLYAAVASAGVAVGTVAVVALARVMPLPVAKIASLGLAFLATVALNKYVVFSAARTKA